MRMWLLGAAALVAITGGCGGESGNQTFTGSGHVELTGLSKAQVLAADGAGPGAHCEGSGSFGDVTEGAEVVVEDAHGTKVALGHLASGKLTARDTDLRQLGADQCVFAFTVPKIPSGDDLFTLTVGQSRLTFREADASRLFLRISGG